MLPIPMPGGKSRNALKKPRGQAEHAPTTQETRAAWLVDFMAREQNQADPPSAAERRSAAEVWLKDLLVREGFIADRPTQSHPARQARRLLGAPELGGATRPGHESSLPTPLRSRAVFGFAALLTIVAVGALAYLTNFRHPSTHALMSGAVAFMPPVSSTGPESSSERRSGGLPAVRDHPRRVLTQTVPALATVTPPKIMAVTAPKTITDASAGHASVTTADDDTDAMLSVFPPQPVKPPPKDLTSMEARRGITGTTTNTDEIMSSTINSPQEFVPLLPLPKKTDAEATQDVAVLTHPVEPLIAARESDSPQKTSRLAQTTRSAGQDGLPSDSAIHLEITYGALTPQSARSIAALATRLGSQISDIASSGLTAGKVKTAGVAYFFPVDRGAATAVAASLSGITKRPEPVERLHRIPQPRPGTIEILLPIENGKDLINEGS